MAADLVISSARVVDSFIERSAPGDEVFGLEAVKYVPASGMFSPANGSGAAEARMFGFAVNACDRIGVTVRVIRKGIIDVGEALALLDFDAPVYLSDTDGTLADTAGSVSVVVGRVIALWTQSGADKALFIDL